MTGASPEEAVRLETDRPIWDRFFTVAPLVVVGTLEGDGYDLAPKHMATPMGWNNFFGFVCSPEHATYGNAREAGTFTVSFPRPGGLVPASLTAAPRPEQGQSTPGLEALTTFPAREIEGVLLEDAYAWLECELERVVDGFGRNSLVVGKVVGAAVRRSSLRVAEGDDQELLKREPVLVYLSPGRYGRVEETDAFPFPADFQR